MPPTPTAGPELTYLMVWLRDGDTLRVLASEEETVTAALQRTAGDEPFAFFDDDRRTTVLTLTTIWGTRASVLSSAVWGCLLTTPDSRREEAAFSAALQAEEASRQTSDWGEVEATPADLSPNHPEAREG